MSLIDSWVSAGFALKPSDIRALSQAELQQHALDQMDAMRGSAPAWTFEYFNAMSPYRLMEPHVPQGWSDWYEIGDQLH